MSHTLKPLVDDELTDFERGLLESIAQMHRGEFAATHTPAQILARRAGRPKGSTKVQAKQAVTVRYSPDVLAAFRAAGPGWQTRMNDALKDWLRTHSAT